MAIRSRPEDPNSVRDQIHRDGFAIIHDLLSSEEVANAIDAIESLGHSDSIRRRGGVFAVRNLLEASTDIHRMACSSAVLEAVKPILGEEAFPVRGILFDKTPDANWVVPWHQDLTIAVAERREVPGFGPWSSKAGVLHVQPPAEVLESVLSIRIHLDPCGEEDGALKVLPGSHRLGRISERDAARLGAERKAAICIAKAGDALLMRPLLVHASLPSASPLHRRVVHLDFAARQLPGGLKWAVSETLSS